MTNPSNSQSHDLPEKHIDNEDLIDLWQYFQDRADTLKDRQWTVVTWILALVSGLIAFSLSQETFSLSSHGIIITKPVPFLVIGMVGVLLCIYGLVVVNDFGKHIQSNWDRTDRVTKKIIHLEYFLKGTIEQEPATSNVSTSRSPCKDAKNVKEICLAWRSWRLCVSKNRELPDVSELSQKPSGIPRESWYLIAILVGYFLLFLGMVLAGLL